jgi:hypothetical protein
MAQYWQRCWCKWMSTCPLALQTHPAVLECPCSFVCARWHACWLCGQALQHDLRDLKVCILDTACVTQVCLSSAVSFIVCAGAAPYPAQAKQDKSQKKKQALLQEMQEAAAREVSR